MHVQGNKIKTSWYGIQYVSHWYLVNEVHHTIRGYESYYYTCMWGVTKLQYYIQYSMGVFLLSTSTENMPPANEKKRDFLLCACAIRLGAKYGKCNIQYSVVNLYGTIIFDYISWAVQVHWFTAEFDYDSSEHNMAGLTADYASYWLANWWLLS